MERAIKKIGVFNIIHEVGHQYRYDLAPDEVRRITQEFLQYTNFPAGRFICVNITYDAPMANAGRTIEHEVFDNTFKNDATLMKAEYGDYEEGSRFLMVIDREEQRPAGLLRLLEDSPAGLKSVNDIETKWGVSVEDCITRMGLKDLSTCWDVATLAIADGYRGPQSSYTVSALLYRALFLAAQQTGINHFITIIDHKALRGVRALGIQFERILETAPQPYLGSKESYPMHVEVDRLLTGVMAKYNEELTRPKAPPILVRVLRGLPTGQGLDPYIQVSS